MISESFIEKCISACCALDDNRVSKGIIEYISFILKSELKELKELGKSIEFREKLDLANYLSSYRLKLKIPFDFEVMVEGMRIGKYSHLIENLEVRDRDLNEDEINKINQIVTNEYSVLEALGARSSIIKRLEKLSAGVYKDTDEFLSDYSKLVNEMYKKKSDRERLKSTNQASFLDLRSSEYDSVMRNLRDGANIIDSVKTGFTFLENTLPSRGLEPKRFYLIGGTSGVGKSVFLANLIGNAVSKPHRVVEEELPTYVYFTAENLIDESLERLYCQMTKTSVAKVRMYYKDPSFDIKDQLKPILDRTNCNVLMYYFKPRSSTVGDLENRIDSLMIPGIKVKGVYIDYLDLFRTGMDHADPRSELTAVAEAFKNMAVTYNTPVVSVTQLNRSGYDPDAQPSLTQMSESMGKINYADVVLFLQEDKEKRVSIPNGDFPITAKNIRMTLLKSRNSMSYKSTNLLMKECIGPEQIFNYVMEEKIDLDISQDYYNSLEDNREF